MSWRPNSTSRSVAVFGGSGLDQSDEVFDGLRRQRRVDRNHHIRSNCERDRLKRLERIIGNFVVKREIDDVVISDDEQGVPIGRWLCGSAHTDIATSAAHVLDVKLLSNI